MVQVTYLLLMIMMKKLVVMGLAMAMTASMVNGVCAQPVQAADGEGLKVALLLSGAANDQGWNQTAYEGAQKACEKYGYELAYTENLEVADISAAYADYASAGYDVVIGHGYEFGDPALEVAETYPDTKFICTEADASADNVASYVMACEQTAYVEGIIAASTSESGKLGAIGPIPGDSLVKIINGYEDGAKSVNPDIEVYEGRIASGDQFVADQAVKDRIVKDFGAYAVEMEGASIAHTAYLNHIPFLVVRAISDKADGSAEMDYPTFEAMAAEHSFKLTLRILKDIQG